MSQSKKIPINKPFLHPVNKNKIPNITAEFIKKHNLKFGDNLELLKDEIKYINLGDIFGILFDHIQVPKPSLTLLYGNIINSINKANEEKIDYINLTKKECEEIKFLFDNTIMIKPEYNGYAMFVRESFTNFVKNFDTLDERDITSTTTPETEKPIKTSS